VKLCDPSLTRANRSALEMSIAHIVKRCTNVPFTYLTNFGGLTSRLVFVLLPARNKNNQNVVGGFSSNLGNR